MGFSSLKKKLESSAAAPAGNKPNNARNVPLRVESYDFNNESVTGVDLFTGETMTIKLRPDSGSRQFQRATIKEIGGKGKMGTREKVYTEIGGVLAFDIVYPDTKADNQLTARWVRPYSHTPDEADVYVTYASPYIAKSGSVAMDVLKTVAACAVTTADELREQLLQAFHSSYSGAVVRMSNGEETLLIEGQYSKHIERINKIGNLTVGPNDALTDEEKGLVTQFIARVKPTKVQKDKPEKFIVNEDYVSDAERDAVNKFLAHKTVDAFLASEKGKELSAEIGTDFVTEVIPIERLYAGTDTLAQLQKKDFEFCNHFKMGEEMGFTETIIATRAREQGGYIISARPLAVMGRPNLYSLKDVPTQNISPKAQPFVGNMGSGDASDDLEDAVNLAAAKDQVRNYTAGKNPAAEAEQDGASNAVADKLAKAARGFGLKPR